MEHRMAQREERKRNRVLRDRPRILLEGFPDPEAEGRSEEDRSKNQGPETASNQIVVSEQPLPRMMGDQAAKGELEENRQGDPGHPIDPCLIQILEWKEDEDQHGGQPDESDAGEAGDLVGTQFREASAVGFLTEDSVCDPNDRERKPQENGFHVFD